MRRPRRPPQDASKLEPGAFYLDRVPQAKHLALSGTKYDAPRAAQLVDKLLGLAGLGGADGGAGGGEGAPEASAARAGATGGGAGG
jgi:hypothetical protein